MNITTEKKSNLRPCTWVWLTLMVLTLAVLAVGQAGLGGVMIVALLLVSTLVKTHIVADYFMGLKQGRPLWRIIMMAYIWIIISMIGLAYWLGIS